MSNIIKKLQNEVLILLRVMKKLFIFILAIIYLSEASGMGLHLHYCMDKLISWGLTESQKRCSTCDHSISCSPKVACQDCCKDELKTAKIDNANKAELVLLTRNFPSETVHLFSFLEVPCIVPYTTIRANRINAPPDTYKVPIFIFNSVFRI
jgi:hypothetical protein